MVQRFNTTHVAAGGPTGGQFGSGSSSSTKPAHGHGGAHGGSHAGHVGHTSPTMSYNPKTNTGTGYGVKGGSPQVKQLQTALNHLGLTDGKGKALAVDGRLGPLTTQAVMAAQTRLGLKANGHVTPALLKRLLALKTLPHRSVSLEGGPMDDERAWRAQMTSASINDLPDSAFAYIEPGGSKDSSGKTTPRSLRHFPVHDKAHVQNALARAPQSPFGDKAMPKIHAAARKYGVDVADDSGRADSLSAYVRSYPLEDISVRTGKTGREVTAYAAVFNTPAEIHDQDGHYTEELDPVVFNRAISDSAPAGGRTNWRVGVFYNHGMTLMGTPSDRHSMPIGVPLEIKPDGRGLLTRTLYHRSDFADEIVEGLESGAIPGYSFSGRFLRSTPLIPRGGFRAERDGHLRTVRRMESTLKEYGPTPFPAYPDAAILGVRSDSLLGAMAADPDLAIRMLTALRDGAREDSPPLSGAPDWDSPPEDSPALGRSGRSVKEEMAAARSAFLQKYGSEHAGNHHPRYP